MPEDPDLSADAYEAIPVLFGRLLIREGLVSEEALAYAVQVQSEINEAFATTALIEGFIDIEQFRRCAAWQLEKAVTFEDALLQLNVLSEQDIAAVREAVARNHTMLGELLVRAGHLTREQLDAALKLFQTQRFL